MRCLAFVLSLCLLFTLTASNIFSERSGKSVAIRTVIADHTVAAEMAVHKDPMRPVRTVGLPDNCGSSLTESSFRMFGFYDPVTGLAVEDSVWTFDHGAADGMEGWAGLDLTTDDFTAFRRVTPAIWSGHDNVPSAPIITGSGSVWLGWFEDEADDACWKAGLGYGNGWKQRFRSPVFTNISGTMTLSFDYFYNVENTYDYVHVIVQHLGIRDTLMSLTGSGGSPGTPLSYLTTLSQTGTFTIVFEFESDANFSDEDSLYTTTLGAFGVDNISLLGYDGVSGPAPPYTFESSLQGWVASAITGVGSQVDVNNVSSYTLLAGGCRLDGNVVSFHDTMNQHPGGQFERFISNVVDLTVYGDDSLNIFAQYDIYEDLPNNMNIYWTWGFTYYPYICPVTFDSIWAPPAGPPYFFYNNLPTCSRIRSYANETSAAGRFSSGTTLVPNDSDSLRFFIEVFSDTSTATAGVSILLDNIYVGVSRAGNILHVPSPSYYSIQAAITAANTGDTVLVRPGTYTGDSNRNLNFGGKGVVLMSEAGPELTIIDCEHSGRGFIFNAGETSSTVVEGFTIINGYDQLPGCAIYVGPISSSPFIKNCIITDNIATQTNYGVVRIDEGGPMFQCCTIAYDSTSEEGGIVIVNAGTPGFDTCNIMNNYSATECVNLVGGSPSLWDCKIDSNTVSPAVLVSTSTTMNTTSVSNNSSDGMYFAPSAPSILDVVYLIGNAGTGLILESNSSLFSNCEIMLNMNGGMKITNVITRAAAGGEEGAVDNMSGDVRSGVELREMTTDVNPLSGSAAGPSSTGAAPEFDHCIFAGNVNTSSNGGGILFDCNNVPSTIFAPIYYYCTITGNSSLFHGGGVAVCGFAINTDIAPGFINCTVASNNAAGNGGGFYVTVTTGGSHKGIISMERTILYDNCSVGIGHEIYSEMGGTFQFDCSVVDSSGVRGTGVVDYGLYRTFEDPSFCDQATCSEYGTIAGDFTLYSNSVADTMASPCRQLIGAYPVNCEPPTTIVAVPDLPGQTVLWQNAPNPFNPTTTIRFDLAEAGQVTLRIYDVSGRLVRTLVEASLQPDRYAYSWDGTNDKGRQVASGIYFGRLTSGSEMQVKKLVLIK